MTAPLFRFVKKEPSRQWFSNASCQAVGGYCLEEGWWCRYILSEDDMSNTVRRGTEKCPQSFGGIHIRSYCVVNSRNLPRSLAAVGEVEKDTLLIKDNGVRAGGGERAGGVHDVLLRARKFLNEKWVGRSLPLDHPRSKAMMVGIKGCTWMEAPRNE